MLSLGLRVLGLGVMVFGLVRRDLGLRSGDSWFGDEDLTWG